MFLNFECSHVWQLPEIYAELSNAKSEMRGGRRASLTVKEWEYLVGLLQGLSPTEIANHYQVSPVTVRGILSDQVYPCVRHFLLQKTGNDANFKSWADVRMIMEELGFKRNENGLVPAWRVDEICADLSLSKSRLRQVEGATLSNRERACLEDLLQGLSPSEIAYRQNVVSSTVRGVLCKSIYPYVKHLFSQKMRRDVEIRHFSHVASMLEELGYKR